jgi:hypothetical protein
MILNFSSQLVTESHVNALPAEKGHVNYLLTQTSDREQAIKLAYKIVEITLKYPECFIIKFENPIRRDSVLYRMLSSLGNIII